VPSHAGDLRHRRVRIIRDYGMNDRGEAPQFFPEVKSIAALPQHKLGWHRLTVGTGGQSP
jgi:hypothetical protein